MPNYEYQCTACDNLFEIWQPVGEAAPACPQCGAVVKKVFHPPRVIFKGSGFYVTDLRAEKAGAASKSSANASSANASSDASSNGDAAKETSTESAKEASSVDKSVDKAAPAKSDNSAPAAPAK